MSQVEFNYFNTITIIQCNMQDKMLDIIKKFLLKCQKKLDEVYFLYDGQPLNKEKTFKEAAKEIDRIRKKMSILVFDNQFEQNVSKIKKSNYIICPKCNESILISINDYKISLYECKNGHKIDKILFNEFEKTQYLDETKIVCDKCKKIKKSETFEQKFFICYSCKINLCPLCRNSHDKSHYIIDYNQKDFICRIHQDLFISYCDVCKKDICTLCQKQHNGHKLIIYGNIIPDIDKFKNGLNQLEAKINRCKDHIKEIILNLNKLMKNLN